MKKKAELSMSVVVMAVIALLILVILSFIALRGTGTFTTGINSCSGDSNEVICAPKGTCANLFGAGNFIEIPQKCSTDYPDPVCCRRVIS